MATVTVEHRQTLLDIAIQYCGAATALVDLAKLNGISITKEVSPGTMLLLPPVVTPLVVNYFSDGDYVLATKPESNMLTGVSNWAISSGFVVS